MLDLLKLLLTFTIKSFIATSMLFLFLSIFVFNIQIQNKDMKGYVTSTTDIVQVSELASLLHTYFAEDCPFICIPNKH